LTNIIDDKAIDKIKYDALDFDSYVHVLAESILEESSPPNIAIYGKYGSGKTSLVKLLINKIHLAPKQKNIINIFYDAWKFEHNNTDSLINLLSTLEKSIQLNKINFKEDVILNIFDYVKYIKIAISKIDNQKNEEKNSDTTSLLEIYELLKKLEDLLVEENFLLIFYIDNLDKCNSANCMKILESMNLIFDLKGFSFVITSDKKLLKDKLINSSIKDFEGYLDKTIQLPFYIPSFSGKMNDLLQNIYLRTNSNTELEKEIKDVLFSISSFNKLTPRLIIKLINRIKVCSKIYIKLNPNTQLSYENILSLFAISCTLEELFNGFHNVLIQSDTIANYIIKIMQTELFYKDEFITNINILNDNKKLLIDLLENNFHILKMIFSTEAGKYWLENKAYRISTYEFLKSNNDIMEDMQINSLPVYKTDFMENIIPVKEKEIDPKKFISIPNNEYEISKYVVTNKWYEEFILSDGYNNTKYWVDLPSQIWLINNKITTLDEKYEKMIEKESIYYRKKFNKELKKEDFNKALQPIVYITYYEALAFCRYLTDIDEKYEYMIPSKRQWEYFANSGDKTRIYPWGNNWDNNYCNNASNQLNKTTEIGMFPQGDSKFGVSDMVGNVWVWTSTLDNNDYNYLKGGSWNFSDPSYFKISNSQMNFYNNPSYQHYDIGFLCIRKEKK
jgi:formylglycine-generating enzyme required for sulfatase activity